MKNNSGKYLKALINKVKIAIESDLSWKERVWAPTYSAI